MPVQHVLTAADLPIDSVVTLQETLIFEVIGPILDVVLVSTDPGPSKSPSWTHFIGSGLLFRTFRRSKLLCRERLAGYLRVRDPGIRPTVCFKEQGTARSANGQKGNDVRNLHQVLCDTGMADYLQEAESGPLCTSKDV